jgi:hypothetical protein
MGAFPVFRVVRFYSFLAVVLVFFGSSTAASANEFRVASRAMDSGFVAIPAEASAYVGRVVVKPHKSNPEIEADLTHPDAKRYYKALPFFRTDAEAPYVLLVGDSLASTEMESSEDQSNIESIARAVVSNYPRKIPEGWPYFRWGVVGKRYALVIRIGDQMWQDMLSRNPPSVFVLERAGASWNVLLRTGLNDFIRGTTSLVEVSGLLSPFLALRTEISHPLLSEEELEKPVVRFDKEIPNPIAVGLRVYNRERCGACHRVAGAGGLLGPDLTHAGSRMPSYAWHMQNLKDPPSLRSKSFMPSYDDLAKKELKALAKFVVSLK